MTTELILYADFYAEHPYIFDKIQNNPDRYRNYVFGMTTSCAASEDLSSDATTMFDCVKKEVILNIENRPWGSMMTMLALSSVVKRKMKSLYPITSNTTNVSVYNGNITPRDSIMERSCTLLIMWSSLGIFVELEVV